MKEKIKEIFKEIQDNFGHCNNVHQGHYESKAVGQAIYLVIKTNGQSGPCCQKALEILQALRQLNIPGNLRDDSRNLLKRGHMRIIKDMADMKIEEKVLESMPATEKEKLISQQRSCQEFVDHFLVTNGAFVIKKTLIPNWQIFV